MPKVRDSLLLEAMIIAAILLVIAVMVVPNFPVLREFFGLHAIQLPLAK